MTNFVCFSRKLSTLILAKDSGPARNLLFHNFRVRWALGAPELGARRVPSLLQKDQKEAAPEPTQGVGGVSRSVQPEPFGGNQQKSDDVLRVGNVCKMVCVCVCVCISREFVCR